MLYVSDVKEEEGLLITVRGTNSEDYEMKFSEDEFLEKFYADGDFDVNNYNMTEDVFGACFDDDLNVIAIPQTREDTLRADSIRRQIKIDKARRRLLGKGADFKVRPVTNDIVVLFDTFGVEKDFKIPSYVTCLGSYFADSDLNSIEHLVIPDNVKYIADNAFGELENLKTIQFTGNLKYLGASIIGNCFSYDLEEVYLPDDIEVIDDDAFKRPDALDMMWASNTIMRIVVHRALYEKHKKAFSLVESYKDDNYKLEIKG